MRGTVRGGAFAAVPDGAFLLSRLRKASFMIPFLIVIGAAAFLAAGYFVLRLCLAVKAISGARTSLQQLADELHAAHFQGAERYSQPLPGRAEFEEERYAVDGALTHLEDQLKKLLDEPLSTRLRLNWVARCRSIAARARNEVQALQDEAFWAQFPRGSDALESRYERDIE